MILCGFLSWVAPDPRSSMFFEHALAWGRCCASPLGSAAPPRPPAGARGTLRSEALGAARGRWALPGWPARLQADQASSAPPPPPPPPPVPMLGLRRVLVRSSCESFLS